MDSRRKPRSSWSRSTTSPSPSPVDGSSSGSRRRVGRPLPGPASLGVAGAHEEPVRPGVKVRRVAELGKVLPDAQQRPLRRVLGKLDVAQDPVRHRMETVVDGHGEARERPPRRRLVLEAPARCPYPPGLIASIGDRRSNGTGATEGAATQSFVNLGPPLRDLGVCPGVRSTPEDDPDVMCARVVSDRHRGMLRTPITGAARGLGRGAAACRSGCGHDLIGSAVAALPSQALVWPR